jgi:hypothetical protein
MQYSIYPLLIGSYRLNSEKRLHDESLQKMSSVALLTVNAIINNPISL